MLELFNLDAKPKNETNATLAPKITQRHKGKSRVLLYLPGTNRLNGLNFLLKQDMESYTFLNIYQIEIY